MWNLYHRDKFLQPLCFSNGKSQEDIVKEVLEAIKEGHKTIFIHGICGTGKSAIALNIARKLGKTSIVVPGKNLQAQYKKDYSGELESKFLRKENGEKLKISVITGRSNHECQFLKDNQNAIPKIKKEVDSKLHDIFAGKREEMKNLVADDISANNSQIPCKIEIKEKNWDKLKRYLKQNSHVNYREFLDIKDIKRVSVAAVCPYWSPVLPDKYEFKNIGEFRKRSYLGMNGQTFNFYYRKPGCKFYEQFNSYIDSDVIVFNSMKYLLETAIGRKPKTEVEIIDECDEFLDNFSNQRRINVERLQNSLIKNLDITEETSKILAEINDLLKQLKRDPRIGDAISSGEILPLKNTGIYDLLRLLLNSQEIFLELDEENYIFDVNETARLFEGFFEDSYVTFEKKDENLVVNIVTTNLAKRLKNLIDKNKILVMMSGTLHSEDVLRSIFGLEDFKIIEAETEQQGNIRIKKTGLEMDCKYSNFYHGKFTRKDYLVALEKSLEISSKPTLVHVNAFIDLPSEEEIDRYKLKYLISRDKLREMQIEDNTGVEIERFKKGDIDILFSTRASRGIDFPGDECKSIIFTKYPNPNVQDAFWKILNKTNPTDYWKFYKDKAQRELWQKIYRGLRFKEDKVEVLSPDSRVLDGFEGY